MLSKMLRIAVPVLVLSVSNTSWAAKICIDPGHGGSDPGAVGSGQQEKINVLDSGLRFRTWLNSDTNDGGGGGSWSVIMTRTTDVYVGLSTRSSFANNNAADRFMSIHNNACCGASGTETFAYTSASANSYDLRNKVQQRSIEAWGLTNRGNKTANFAVLRETNMPAELAELGFIDHPYDSQFTGSATQRDKMSKYHMFALQNHYGITAYTPGGGGAVTYTDDSPVDSGSWSIGTSAADKYGADYKYHSTAAVSDPATWTISVATGGSYNVYAWWSVGTNRSTSAPYILPNGGTSYQNQQANGGRFNLLGTMSLTAGAHDTKLSIWTTSGYVVIADAVRYIGPN
ncbi:MAG: N-acetylmuramoyl-L-alanine amidase [Candidatus Sumerlaeaceae bacterium]